MKIRSIFTVMLLVLTLSSPLAGMAYGPPPRPNMQRAIAEMLERIKEAIERRNIERAAEMQERLQMPGGMPVVEPPIPMPDRIDPAKVRWIHSDKIPAEVFKGMRLIPKEKE